MVTDHEIPSIRGAKDSEATRAALLTAGRELFAEQGYDGTSVEQITSRAGVNKAMVSYHFKGKEGLYAAILESTFAPVLEQLAALSNLDLPADRMLEKVVETLLEARRQHPAFPAMMVREVISRGRHSGVDPLRYPMQIFAIVREILVRGMREGVFRPVDPLATHLSMVGSLLFFFATEPARQRVALQTDGQVRIPTDEDFARHVIELNVRGLRAEPSQRKRPRKPGSPA